MAFPVPLSRGGFG
ncbi:hypothetical protein VCHC70A1_3259, partial [Vibrio cholerae HC-70A1]